MGAAPAAGCIRFGRPLAMVAETAEHSALETASDISLDACSWRNVRFVTAVTCRVVERSATGPFRSPCSESCCRET